MTSKCGKLEQKSGTGGAAECVTDVLTTFWLPLWSIKPGFHIIVRNIFYKDKRENNWKSHSIQSQQSNGFTGNQALLGPMHNLE